jgi:hypothetical protein
MIRPPPGACWLPMLDFSGGQPKDLTNKRTHFSKKMT